MLTLDVLGSGYMAGFLTTRKLLLRRVHIRRMVNALWSANTRLQKGHSVLTETNS